LRLDGHNISFFTDPDKLRILVQSGNLAHTRVLVVLTSIIATVFALIANQREILLAETHARHHTNLIYIAIFSRLNHITVSIVKHAPGLKSSA
jgi:hypothetical protein